MKELESNKKLGSIIPNVAAMLNNNLQKFGDRIAYSEKVNNQYKGIRWENLYRDIENAAFNLQCLGFRSKDKVVLFSRNRLEMLTMELAIMSSGGIAVPIYANFKQATAELLIKHSKAKYLVVGGKDQLDNISTNLPLDRVFTLDNISDARFPDLIQYRELLTPKTDPSFKLNDEISPEEFCLYMYTSGTMGTPKCVQLSHQNILSQQAALKVLWNLDENDRFLSYLPWHHSFGGIFELFSALSHGATLYLESSFGKDPVSIFSNWEKVKPTVFFSVPKVYRELIELTKKNKAAENLFFNTGLKFIFTAAAALPEKISAEFESRGIPVIEGWGLTETSPCCTLTDPKEKREPGVVGRPIPGVSIRIGEENEIQVKGPNVMAGYFDNPEANKEIWTNDGWFKTGDVGKITPLGLKLISRKDRIFKLSNGEKVIPTDLEKLIEQKCHYISYAVVTGKEKDYPVALIFPNKGLLEGSNYEITPLEGCFCPRNLNELGRCLSGCLNDANNRIQQKFSKIKSAAIIDDVLSLDKNTLTPSLKMAPTEVLKKYKDHLRNMYGEDVPVEEDIYMIELGEKMNITI